LRTNDAEIAYLEAMVAMLNTAHIVYTRAAKIELADQFLAILKKRTCCALFCKNTFKALLKNSVGNPPTVNRLNPPWFNKGDYAPTILVWRALRIAEALGDATFGGASFSTRVYRPLPRLNTRVR
jgi:hypothetical protein